MCFTQLVSLCARDALRTGGEPESPDIRIYRNTEKSVTVRAFLRVSGEGVTQDTRSDAFSNASSSSVVCVCESGERKSAACSDTKQRPYIKTLIRHCTVPVMGSPHMLLLHLSVQDVYSHI